MTTRKTQKTQQEAKEEKTQINFSISEIDLTNQPVNVLLDLKEKLDKELRKVLSYKLKDSDLVIEYDIKLVGKEGVIAVNEGSSRLNSIMNKRIIVEAPRRFESEF